MCPPRSKQMIIGRIQSEERCGFFGSSKISNIEVQQATGLEITKSQEDIIYITVKQGSANSGFMLKFGEMERSKYMKFMTLDSQEKSVNVLDDSTNLYDYAARHFKDLLEQHQNIIEKLHIHTKIFEDKYDFGVNRLINLKELGVDSRFLLQFLTKLQHPLDVLKVYGKTSNARLEMLLKVHLRTSNLIRFYAPHIDCDFDQLNQLNLKYSTMSIGQLTEEDLASFIRLWQRGKIESSFKQMTWNLDKSENFNIQKLFSYLRVLGVTKNKTGWYEIEHLNDSTKRLLIFVQQQSLTFEWSYDEEVSEN